MIAGSLLMIVGTQVLGARACARTPTARTSWASRTRGSTACARASGSSTACCSAAAIAVAGVADRRRDRRHLDRPRLRRAVRGAARGRWPRRSIIVGLQIFFSSFLLSILGLRRRDAVSTDVQSLSQALPPTRPIPPVMTRLRLRDAQRLRDDRGASSPPPLLVIVSLGVLKGLDTANRSSGREKARAVAAALTEQDQERLRSFRAVDLANYDETRTVDRQQAPVHDRVRGDWVRDSTGGTESCNNTTVAGRLHAGHDDDDLGPDQHARSLRSRCRASSPRPIGAFGTNQGTLGVQVNDRDGAGVAGIPVTITGPARTRTTTNSAGCAIFAYVPVGSYTASVNQAGWVDHGGDDDRHRAAPPSPTARSASPRSTYDRAASVAVELRHRAVAARRRPRLGPRHTQLSASNSAVPGRAAVLGRRPAAFGTRRRPPARPRSPPPACSRSPTATASSAAAAAAPTRRHNDSDYYTTSPGALRQTPTRAWSVAGHACGCPRSTSG